MPKRRPVIILRKVSRILKRSIYIAKHMSPKPIIPRLILLKKWRKANSKTYNYQYRFLREYEFSPSSTPLIFYRSTEPNNRSFRNVLDSFFFLCGCFGKVTTSATLDIDAGPLALPPANYMDALLGDFDFDQGDEDSVDQRAQMFIDKFYEEMRMQRRLSI